MSQLPDHAGTGSQGIEDWIALDLMARRVGSVVVRELRRSPLRRSAEYRLLRHLAGAGQATLCLSDLADALMTTKSGVHRLVNRLERLGMLRRVPSEIDRRVTYIELTESGRVLAGCLEPAVSRAVEQFLGDHLAVTPGTLALMLSDRKASAAIS